MSIANHPIITDRYFFPRRAPLPDARMVGVKDVQLACFEAMNGHELTVVHFHGNGEIVSDYLPAMAEEFNRLGANAFFAEYRGYGASTGTPQLGAMLDDVAAIRDAVDAPDEQIVVFGRSIGSIYAIEFAARFPKIAGLVLESGIADVLERILLRATPAELGATRSAIGQEFERLFDHRDKLARYKGPTLVMHAIHDHLVDKSHGERNAEWAAGDVKLVLFERGDHNTIYGANKAQYLEELSNFFNAIRSR